jgi:hypothetical protein
MLAERNSIVAPNAQGKQWGQGGLYELFERIAKRGRSGAPWTHADLTTTMRYAHVLKSGIARLETFVSSQAPEEPPPDSGARPFESSPKRVA